MIEDEISKLKILNDIYKNENEQLKYEYRVLFDKYQENIKLNEQYLNELNLLKQNYSIKSKIKNKIRNTILFRVLRKVKRIIIKKG